jgi:hypothetical protein
MWRRWLAQLLIQWKLQETGCPAFASLPKLGTTNPILTAFCHAHLAVIAGKIGQQIT